MISPGYPSSVLMPFGKYKGQPLANLPDGYLDWLIEIVQIDKSCSLWCAIRDERELREAKSQRQGEVRGQDSLTQMDVSAAKYDDLNLSTVENSDYSTPGKWRKKLDRPSVDSQDGIISVYFENIEDHL